jgi:3-(3-hydroxy-phenyl)propionate hydroxylase
LSSYDVAIVGMGPVGAAAAILFADAGLKVIAFERDAHVYPLPRAVALDGEVVRGFQRVGRAGELAALLQPVRPGERAGFANSRLEWLFGQPYATFGVNGWQPISMFDQPELEAHLRRLAMDHSGVTGCLEVQVETFEETGGQVAIRARQADGALSETSARFLVACDGAASGARRALEIGWRDLGYDHDWLVVDVVLKDGHTLGLDTLQVCDPDRLSTYIATKDPFRRWEFKLNPGETREEMLEPERIRELIDPWTPRGTYEIRRSAVYQFHAATAETWRKGRVLLAGDAAHQTPPFLGQGLNAGMRDVINLAWKLPLVLSGAADEGLLDSYQAERGAHAADLVEWAVAIGKLMEHLAAVEAAQRVGRKPPEVPDGNRASGYGQGREAPPLRDGVVMVDQVSEDGSTGYLFRQPAVRDAGGEEYLLDDRLGAGFALVARSEADLAMSEASRAIVDALGMSTTTLEGLEATRGRFDRLFEGSAAAVVRPDRYVFGHTSQSLSLDALLGELAARLGLRL